MSTQNKYQIKSHAGNSEKNMFTVLQLFYSLQFYNYSLYVLRKHTINYVTYFTVAFLQGFFMLTLQPFFFKVFIYMLCFYYI